MCEMAKTRPTIAMSGPPGRADVHAIQYKGRNRKSHKLTLPILPALQRIIDASPCGDLTFLVNEFGRPSTDAGFGNKFRDWCDQANLPQCSAQGLRKAGVTSLQTMVRPRVN